MRVGKQTGQGEEEITVLLADDHALVLQGLSALINGCPRFRVVAQAESGEQAVYLYDRLRPQIALIDLQMPDAGGAQLVERICALDPEARIVLLATFDGDDELWRALRAGASGAVFKDATAVELSECLMTVASGRTYVASA